MSEFVDQCRAEWHRLGVPDAITNEMAADFGHRSRRSGS
jgi:hypothetical protein